MSQPTELHRLSQPELSSSTSSITTQTEDSVPKEIQPYLESDSPRSQSSTCCAGSDSENSTAGVSSGKSSSQDSNCDSDSDNEDEPLPAYWWLLGDQFQQQGQAFLQQQQQQSTVWPTVTSGTWNGSNCSAGFSVPPVFYGDLPQLPKSYFLAKRDERKLSCLLSKTLRHTAHSWGLHIGADGFVCVSELLARPPFWEVGATLFDVMFVVQWEQREGNKQRFAMRQGAWGPEIRATQGHSQGAVDGQLVSRLADPAELPPLVLHGTYTRYMKQIMADGLRPMSRHHVHMFVEEGGIGRENAEVHIHVDVAKAHAAGIEFLVSENGVVLSTGGTGGVIPAKCFHKVVRVCDGEILTMTDAL